MAKDVNLIRIKADTNDYERNIKQAQKTWDDFTRGIGVNIGKITGVAAAIGAVTGALKIAKDAFAKNEEMLDEWGRTVQSAESLYSGFLNALNTGDISGYLRNMNNIVSAARAAYDAMDELGTFNAFNQINVAKAQTNLTNAMADYREGSGSKEGVKAAAAAMQKELQARQKREQEVYDAAINRYAAERGVNPEYLRNAMSGSYGHYEQLRDVQMTGTGYKYVGGGGFGGGQMVEVKVAANETEKLGEALRKLTDNELQDLQALGAAAYKTSNEIANIDRQVARILRGGTGGTSGGSGGGKTKAAAEKYTPVVGSIDYQIQKVKELQEAFNQASEQGVRQGLLVQLKQAEGVLKLMREEAPSEMFIGGSGYGLSQFTSMDRFKDVKIEGNDLEALQTLADAGEKADDSWGSALQSISGLGSALAGIEDPAVKVFSIIAEAIATVALSFAKALSKEHGLGVWGWIAAAAAGTATMLSTIGAIKSATAGGFAQGGIVPGNSFSGDNLRTSDYGINSGELILNRAQQNSIASQLSNGGMQNLKLTATIKGTDIQLVLNNTARQQGRGTYVTAR